MFETRRSFSPVPGVTPPGVHATSPVVLTQPCHPVLVTANSGLTACTPPGPRGGERSLPLRSLRPLLLGDGVGGNAHWQDPVQGPGAPTCSAPRPQWPRPQRPHQGPASSLRAGGPGRLGVGGGELVVWPGHTLPQGRLLCHLPPSRHCVDPSPSPSFLGYTLNKSPPPKRTWTPLCWCTPPRAALLSCPPTPAGLRSPAHKCILMFAENIHLIEGSSIDRATPVTVTKPDGVSCATTPSPSLAERTWASSPGCVVLQVGANGRPAARGNGPARPTPADVNTEGFLAAVLAGTLVCRAPRGVSRQPASLHARRAGPASG